MNSHFAYLFEIESLATSYKSQIDENGTCHGLGIELIPNYDNLTKRSSVTQTTS